MHPPSGQCQIPLHHTFWALSDSWVDDFQGESVGRCIFVDLRAIKVSSHLRRRRWWKLLQAMFQRFAVQSVYGTLNSSTKICNVFGRSGTNCVYADQWRCFKINAHRVIYVQVSPDHAHAHLQWCTLQLFLLKTFSSSTPIFYEYLRLESVC